MPTIHRIEVSNPFFEGRNSVYLLKGDPITLIDTGIATDRAYERLTAGLREFGVEVEQVRRVLLTHKHIDHIGNAWRIQRASGAEVFVHESEMKSLTDVDPTGVRFRELVMRRLEAWGVPSEVVSKNTSNEMPLWKLESCDVQPLPERIDFDGGDQLEVIHTPGHTMGSVCFRLPAEQAAEPGTERKDCLFSGDHVLERISPNVGGGDMRSQGMLARFLDSLDRVAALGDLEIYPGHGESFRGLAARCERLQKHHERRLAQAQNAVESGKHLVYEVARTLYGKLKDFHIVLGCAEANAHLEYLAAENKLAQDGDQYFAPNSES